MDVSDIRETLDREMELVYRSLGSKKDVLGLDLTDFVKREVVSELVIVCDSVLSPSSLHSQANPSYRISIYAPKSEKFFQDLKSSPRDMELGSENE